MVRGHRRQVTGYVAGPRLGGSSGITATGAAAADGSSSSPQSLISHVQPPSPPLRLAVPDLRRDSRGVFNVASFKANVKFGSVMRSGTAPLVKASTTARMYRGEGLEVVKRWISRVAMNGGVFLW